MSFEKDVAILRDKLSSTTNDLYLQRVKELQLKQALSNARDSLAMAETDALITANGEIDGKNADERKLKQSAYLSKHPDVVQAREDMQEAEAALEDARVDLQLIVDCWSGIRHDAELLGSLLNYLSKQGE